MENQQIPRLNQKVAHGAKPRNFATCPFFALGCRSRDRRARHSKRTSEPLNVVLESRDDRKQIRRVRFCITKSDRTKKKKSCREERISCISCLFHVRCAGCPLAARKRAANRHRQLVSIFSSQFTFLIYFPQSHFCCRKPLRRVIDERAEHNPISKPHFNLTPLARRT